MTTGLQPCVWDAICSRGFDRIGFSEKLGNICCCDRNVVNLLCGDIYFTSGSWLSVSFLKTNFNCPSRALALVSLQKYRSSIRCETLALSCFSRIVEAPEGFSVAAGQYILYGEPG